MAPGQNVETRLRRILVVDDDEQTAELFVQVFRAMGHQALSVCDPTKAIDIARRFCPDIALLDIAMPVIDGYVLARTLKAIPELANVRLVAVTGSGEPDDYVRSRRAGFDAHVRKPADSHMLASVLQQVQSDDA